MLRTLLRLVFALFVLAALLVVGLIVWVNSSYQRDFSATPLPDIHASLDPAVIAQGQYLVEAVAHCSECHRPAYYVRKRQPSADPTDLRGGYAFRAGPFGTFYAANLSSDAQTGIGAWSDGQLARVIRHGVDRNGHFAVFMALSIGALSDQDLTAVISYLRTLPPTKNAVPGDRWGFAAKVLAHFYKPHDEPRLQHVPPGGLSVERGRYLANGPAGCYTCHSARNPLHGFEIEGPRFAGNPQPEPDETDAKFELVAPNLSSDPVGRTGQWSEDKFVARFKMGVTLRGTHMPWESFQRMREDDLRSIYRYLRSVPPVSNDLGPSRRLAGWKR